MTSKQMGIFRSCCLCSSNESRRLLEVNYKTAPKFSLDGSEHLGVVVDVYDGDTCTIAMMFHGEVLSFRCRLLGLDTPELKGAATKDSALLARNALINMVSSQTLIDINASREDVRKHLGDFKKLMRVECGDWDKYGRLLVTMYPNDGNRRALSCNQRLLDGGYAKPYDGGTKI